MKTKFFLIGMFFLSILIFTSCNSDSNPAPASTDNTLTLNEVTATQTMDNAIDDVSVIADDQYELSEGSPTGKVSSASYFSLTPSCATISDLGSTLTVRKITLTFGSATTSCLFRGHHLRGQIILTRTFSTTFPKIMTITYNDFHINDNKLEGTSTWKREMLGTGTTLHPKTTFTMTNMTLTTKEAVIYTRNGERFREMTAGFLTRTSPNDDVFSTWGTFTTTSSNGNVYSSSIAATSPLINKTACGLQATPRPFPVSGVLKLSRNSRYVTIDYGTGDCDNLAMLSVDGGVATQITLKD